MNFKINDVRPSVLSGLYVVTGTINDDNFKSEIYEGTRKLESIKIEDTYIYLENKDAAFDVNYKPASLDFVMEFQQLIKSKTRHISARS